MVSWKDLENVPNRWDQSGYEFIDMNSIIGKSIFVEDYELFESNNYGPGVRILLSDNEGNKSYTATYGSVIVKGFKENPDKVTELVKSRIPVKFVMQTSQTGKKYISFE